MLRFREPLLGAFTPSEEQAGRLSVATCSVVGGVSREAERIGRALRSLLPLWIWQVAGTRPTNRTKVLVVLSFAAPIPLPYHRDELR